MPTGTVSFHRVLRAPPQRVFRAFTEPAALCRWLPPHGFTAEVQQFDARLGGRHHLSFTNFGTGHTQGFGGEYLEFVPGERLRYTDQFDGTALPGTMQVTVTFKAVSCGTELHVVQEGIPEAIPTEMCCLGWQESLEQLARLVEPEIPNG